MYQKAVVLGLVVTLLSACGGGDSSSTEATIETINSRLTNALPAATTQLPYHSVPQIEGVNSAAHFTAIGLPDWASIAPDTGVISGVPDIARAAIPIMLSATAGNKRYQADALLKVEHAAAYNRDDILDFYSKDYDGNPRSLRNDLSLGELGGEVQFVQSHSVRPAGNFQENKNDQTRSVYSPKLVSQRDALLLFLPAVANTPTTVDVEVLMNGAPLGVFAMAHPRDLPASGYQGPVTVEYSTHAWSYRLPWQWVKAGLSLRFVADKGAASETDGRLLADQIDMGEASQLVLQTVRLGMLTEPPTSDGHFTLHDPILAASDYFQTVPVSRLILGSYADVTLNRVMLANGTVYDVSTDASASSDNGGVHHGDMRENVGKSQVSVGINMANYGYTSNNMLQNYPHVFKQITNHHARGRYANGDVTHGLSGGNGIGTLYNSQWNEASHEWGHAYGLGHYPGKGLTTDGRWAVHHADSGWGFNAFRNRMRDNMHHNTYTAEEQPAGRHFNGHIPYGTDAMSDGYGSHSFSRYTYHTAFSARYIQNDLARFPIPDSSFATGYKKWNAETGQYEAYDDGQSRPVAKEVGVPVATMLGAYDPDGDKAVIHPTLHGNYGNVFDLQKPDVKADNVCWVAVSNAGNEQVLVEIANKRHNNRSLNQFHFNLPAEFKPTAAVLSCKRDGQLVEMDRITMDPTIPELPPVAIVGQEHGYQQLKARELVELEKALLALEDIVPLLAVPGRVQDLLTSFSEVELQEGLSDAAQTVLARFFSNQQKAVISTLLINRMEAESASRQAISEALLRQLQVNGLLNDISELAMEGHVIQGNGYTLSTTPDENGRLPLIANGDTQTGENRWIMTDASRVRPAVAPWLCLEPGAGGVRLQGCQLSKEEQNWEYRETSNSYKRGGQCIDLHNGNKTADMYRCTAEWNQKWTAAEPVSSPLLSLLSGEALIKVYDYLLPN